MDNINEIMAEYRNAVRTTWNCGIWPVQDVREWDSVDKFSAIRSLLFELLVLDRIPRAGHQPSTPCYFIWIKPAASQIPGMVEGITQHGSRMWDYHAAAFEPERCELRYVEYFDWNLLNYLELRYYLVEVVSRSSRPEFVGKQALVEVEHTLAFADL